MASRPQIASLIQAYLDGEISPAEKVIFEQELETDAALRTELAQARAVSAQLFEALGAQKLSRDLTAGIMGHLPEMEGMHERLRHESVHEATWRTKHPRSRASWLFTMIPAVATALLAVLGLAIFQAWPGSGPQPRVVGMLTAVGGHASLHAAEATRPASLMALLHEGDTLETREDGRLLLALAGPTMIKTPDNSRVKVLGARSVQVEKGRAWLSVAKHAERFRVHTSMGDITVFGTVFSVEAEADQVRVTLEEGEVTVENGHDFVVLNPGQQAVMRLGQTDIVKEEVDARQVHAWANALQPEPAAHAEFKAAIAPLPDSVLRAEQVWWVDTHDRRNVRAMAFSWTGASSSAMSYDVLVYNENMQPLFSRRLDGALLASGASQAELQIPEGKALGGTTTFIRLVPDESTGYSEVNFREVSLIGAQSPAGQ